MFSATRHDLTLQVYTYYIMLLFTTLASICITAGELQLCILYAHYAYQLPEYYYLVVQWY